MSQRDQLIGLFDGHREWLVDDDMLAPRRAPLAQSESGFHSAKQSRRDRYDRGVHRRSRLSPVHRGSSERRVSSFAGRRGSTVRGNGLLRARNRQCRPGCRSLRAAVILRNRGAQHPNVRDCHLKRSGRRDCEWRGQFRHIGSRPSKAAERHCHRRPPAHWRGAQ